MVRNRQLENDQIKAHEANFHGLIFWTGDLKHDAAVFVIFIAMGRESHIWIFCMIFILGCSYTEKIRDGKTAFERKRYYQAAEMLQNEYNAARGSIERGNIAYLIGESYLKFNNLTEATKWFKEAYDLGYGTSALAQYAFCLKQNERYEEAAEAFYQAGEEIGDRIKFRREISNCLQAIDWRDAEAYSPYKTEMVEINSAASDYSPVMFSEDRLVFSSDRETSKGDLFYAWTGQKFSDIYVAHLSSESVNPFEETLNTEDNEGSISFSPDRNQMVFCRCFSRSDYDSHCKLLITSKRDGHWSKPEVLPFVKDEANYRHPAFTSDGTGLIFSSNLEEATRGYDLYIVYLDEGKWGDPQPLSSRLNTEYDELFPFIHDDTLYYSSNMGGMGGLDIFRSHVLRDGSWAPPLNMMAPINSGSDDFGFIVNPYFEVTDSILQSGFFSSSRSGGKGSDDIYRFEKNKYHPEPPAPPEPEFEYEIVLDLRVFQKEYEDPDDPNSKVRMRVPLSNAKISVTEDGAAFRETSSDQYGMLTLNLTPEKKYDFFVSHPGFFNNQIAFSTRDLVIDSSERVQRFEERILLDKIFLDKEVVLENIYYDLDEDFIREDAKPTLNELADLLKINPQIRIQLSSHTDCRAGDDYNLDLSQRRAESAIQYLMDSGINADRLTAKGYGETLLAVDCQCEECTEEQHQANRRTTFKVIE